MLFVSLVNKQCLHQLELWKPLQNGWITVYGFQGSIEGRKKRWGVWELLQRSKTRQLGSLDQRAVQNQTNDFDAEVTEHIFWMSPYKFRFLSGLAYERGRTHRSHRNWSHLEAQIYYSPISCGSILWEWAWKRKVMPRGRPSSQNFLTKFSLSIYERKYRNVVVHHMIWRLVGVYPSMPIWNEVIKSWSLLLWYGSHQSLKGMELFSWHTVNEENITRRAERHRVQWSIYLELPGNCHYWYTNI